MEPQAVLELHEAAVAQCTACSLSNTRATVVVGGGPVDAEVMIVGEAPGFHEERDATPFAGAPGELLARLLADVCVELDQTYRTTLLKCRPPANRDPLPEELSACEPHLFRQVELVRPRVIVTLGTLATRVLSGREHPITRVHGRAQSLTVAGFATSLLPVYHPAVALYTPAMQQTLAADLAVLPSLVGRDPEAGRAAEHRDAPMPVAPEPEAPSSGEPRQQQAQLGLF